MKMYKVQDAETKLFVGSGLSKFACMTKRGHTWKYFGSALSAANERSRKTGKVFVVIEV